MAVRGQCAAIPAARLTRHWITRIARTMISGDIARPNALAVFEFTIGLEVTGCLIRNSLRPKMVIAMTLN